MNVETVKDKILEIEKVKKKITRKTKEYERGMEELTLELEILEDEFNKLITN